MKVKGKRLLLFMLPAALACLLALNAGGIRDAAFTERAAGRPSCGETRDEYLAPFFSPHGGAEEAVVTEIDGAGQEILVAMYSFTSAGLARALVRARERGVRVCVILDEGQRIREGSGANGRKSAYLVENGVEVHFDSVSGLMHNKFAVIDRRLVITGSYNWTESAGKRNFENLLIIRSARLAGRYAEEFSEIKSRCATAHGAHAALARRVMFFLPPDTAGSSCSCVSFTQGIRPVRTTPPVIADVGGGW